MFLTRLKSVLILIPLMIVMIYIGGIPFQAFVLLILCFAAWEYWHMLRAMQIEVPPYLIMGGVALIALQRIFWGFEHSDILLVLLFFIIIVYFLVAYERGRINNIVNFAVSLSGILYIGWVGSYLISIRALPDGRWWLLTALPITWLVDLGAYSIGKPFGKHKMLPRLSPKKSWEGFAGGILFGVVSGGLLSLLWRPFMADIPAWQGMLLGLIMAVITPVGDLFISMFKRVAGLKDTSNVIPGHGGVLDRIDTWIWAALIGYYYAVFFA